MNSPVCHTYLILLGLISGVTHVNQPRSLTWSWYLPLFSSPVHSTIYITIIPWARVGYNHFISNKGKWNNCFSKFSNRLLPPIFISTILQSVRNENLAHYFPYDVKLGLLAHSRRFLANQKARNAIVGAENLLKLVSPVQSFKWTAERPSSISSYLRNCSSTMSLTCV